MQISDICKWSIYSPIQTPSVVTHTHDTTNSYQYGDVEKLCEAKSGDVAVRICCNGNTHRTGPLKCTLINLLSYDPLKLQWEGDLVIDTVVVLH
jgi:hypothetical protein